MKKFLIALIAGVVILGLYLVGFYNRLITLSQGIDNQWAAVETEYQRRFDLIPNLVSSVEGIMKQEQEVFLKIAEARTRYAGAGTVEDKVQAASEVESALARLLVVIENYPQLRSSENVTQLMDELAGTENRISIARRRYNERVQEYNIAIKKIPGNIFAGMFGFDPRSYFEAVAEAEEAPAVEINP